MAEGVRVIEISFEAPAEPLAVVATERMSHSLSRVWTAHTEALFLRQWWAPHGYTNRTADFDPRPGGAWHVLQVDPDGHEFAFYGRVEAVEPQALLVRSLTSELFPEVATTLRIDLAATALGTLVVTSHLFPDERTRTGFVNLGGITRMREASQRLDALLTSMA